MVPLPIRFQISTHSNLVLANRVKNSVLTKTLIVWVSFPSLKLYTLRQTGRIVSVYLRLSLLFLTLIFHLASSVTYFGCVRKENIGEITEHHGERDPVYTHQTQNTRWKLRNSSSFRLEITSFCNCCPYVLSWCTTGIRSGRENGTVAQFIWTAAEISRQNFPFSIAYFHIARVVKSFQTK